MMAKENRENISVYFVEQLVRLATAIHKHPIELWNRITALMTDSASKNLKIIPLINEKLRNLPSNSPVNFEIKEPLHLLCIIHTIECFDRKMMEIVKKVGTYMY